MSYSNDVLENARRRSLDLTFNAEIEVYEPTESFTQGEGWSVSYPDSPVATYKAVVEKPDSDAERERAGTTDEVDVVIHVRDNTGQPWVGFGEETDAPIRIRDTTDGVRYEIQSVIDTHDGRIQLEAVEV